MNLELRQVDELTSAEIQARIYLLQDLSKSHSATYRTIQQACRNVFLLDPTIIPCLNQTKDELLDLLGNND